MAVAPKQRAMTADEFLIWCLDQEERYEFIDGDVFKVYAMAGASRSHDRIVSNVIVSAGSQLRGTDCWAATSDTALRTSIKRVRRPDVTIECAPPDAATYEAQNPVATFEILSPTTERGDKMVKLPEYMRHPTLRTVALVDPGRVKVLLFQKDEAGEWQGSDLRLPEDEIAILGTDAKLQLRAIYDGVVAMPPPAPPET